MRAGRIGEQKKLKHRQSFLKAPGGALTETVDADLLTHYYVLSLAALLESWLLGEIDRTPEQLIQFTDTILNDQMRGAAQRLKQGPAAPAEEQ